MIKVSASSTNPDGYSTETSRKIAGFHGLCYAVGTISGHDLSGYVAGDILPCSVWDLKHRPVSEPEGMVYDEKANIWVDIYLASGVGSDTASEYNGVISDMRNWMDFVDDGLAVKKRLPWDHEFQSFAAGSNEETNIDGSADPVTTGGHVDTATPGRRMISDIGCEDCCGVMWQWLLDQSYRYDGTGWGYKDLPGDKGRLLSQGAFGDVKLIAGGRWDSGTIAGSQCRNKYCYRWFSGLTVGARLVAEAKRS